MTMEGKVTVVERVATLTPSLESDSIIALVGTGDGLKDGVLTDNIPQLFSSASAAISALRPDSGTPTGSLWNALLGVQANVHDRVIVVQSADATATNVDIAVDTLLKPVQNIFPDLVSVTGLNAAASSASDEILGHLSDLCDSIDAVFAVQIKSTGANKAAQIANAKAYADNNGRQRGILIFPGGSVDISAHYLAALARHDAELNRGANPRGLSIRGISATIPRLEYNFQGRGAVEDDVATLLESNIVPIIEFNGVKAWGTRFSGFGATDTSPYKFIHARRTADQIAIHGQQIAQPYLVQTLTGDIASSILAKFGQYLSNLQNIRQISGYLLGTLIDDGAGNYTVPVRFNITGIPNSITVEVTTAGPAVG